MNRAWHLHGDVPRKGSEDQGAQIDLLFDRLDGAVTLCEIKCTEQPFKIDKKYAQQLLTQIRGLLFHLHNFAHSALAYLETTHPILNGHPLPRISLNQKIIE